jgi:hypothetical protein
MLRRVVDIQLIQDSPRFLSGGKALYSEAAGVRV